VVADLDVGDSHRLFGGGLGAGLGRLHGGESLPQSGTGGWEYDEKKDEYPKNADELHDTPPSFF